jgi:hypothetical protein
MEAEGVGFKVLVWSGLVRSGLDLGASRDVVVRGAESLLPEADRAAGRVRRVRRRTYFIDILKSQGALNT